jgi:hypothetical protein
MFGVAWGDYDADGWFDIAVANESGATLLYRNRGDGTFEEVSSSAGTREVLGATSPAWLDADNDGDLDLYMVNLDNPASLFDNLSDHLFALSGVGGVDVEARAVAAADFNRDGSEDLYVSAQGGGTLLAGTPLAGEHFLEVKLTGRESNHYAVGARVRVRTGARSIWREVVGGQAWGSQPDAVLHFGLGASLDADSLVVFWPSGRVTALGPVAGDRLHSVDEDSGEVSSPPSAVSLTSAPNPFNASTGLTFDVPDGAAYQPVTAAIYSVTGRLERTLYSGAMAAGRARQLRWDGKLGNGEPAPVGLHYCKLTLGGAVRTLKLVLLR